MAFQGSLLPVVGLGCLIATQSASAAPVATASPAAPLQLRAGPGVNLSASEADRRYHALLRTDAQLKVLKRYLVAQGFEAGGREQAWGMRQAQTRSGGGASYEFIVRDFVAGPRGSAAALVRIELSDGEGHSETRVFALMAPEGEDGQPEFQQAQEFVVGEAGDVVSGAGWWTCWNTQLGGANQSCASSLVQCGPSAAAGLGGYLGCAAESCGVAYLQASLCCACGSDWCHALFCTSGPGCPEGTIWCRYDGNCYPPDQPESAFCVPTCGPGELFCPETDTCYDKGTERCGSVRCVGSADCARGESCLNGKCVGPDAR